MSQATDVGKMLGVDQSWEAPCNKLLYPGGVVIDPASGQWRMYYELRKDERNGAVAMATSTDGIHWTKPALIVTVPPPIPPIRTTTSSRLAQRPGWSVPAYSSVAMRPADQRDRMTATTYNAESTIITLYAYTSADGLSRRQVGTIQIADWSKGFAGLDSENTVFWDPTTDSTGRDRVIGYRAQGHPQQPSRRDDEAVRHLERDMDGLAAVHD